MAIFNRKRQSPERPLLTIWPSHAAHSGPRSNFVQTFGPQPALMPFSFFFPPPFAPNPPCARPEIHATVEKEKRHKRRTRIGSGFARIVTRPSPTKPQGVVKLSMGAAGLVTAYSSRTMAGLESPPFVPPGGRRFSRVLVRQAR
jgi:hypothetical protein